MSKRDASTIIYRNDYRTRYINYVVKHNAKDQPFLNIVGGSGGANEASEVTKLTIGSTMVPNDEMDFLLNRNQGGAISRTSTLFIGPPIPHITVVAPTGIFMSDGSRFLYTIPLSESPVTYPAPIASLAVGPTGKVYVATATDIYENTPSGIVNMNITGLTNIITMVVGDKFYIVQDSEIFYAVENSPAESMAGSSSGFADGLGVFSQFKSPMGLALSSDLLWVSDTGNSLIRTITLSSPHIVETLAGNSIQYLDTHETANVGNRDGTGIHGESLLNYPQGITFANSTLFIADTGNNNIRALTNGALRTISGKFGSPPIYEQSPNGYLDTESINSLWDAPVSIFASGQFLYVSEPLNNAVRVVTIV